MVGDADHEEGRTRGTEGVQAVVVKDASAIGERELAFPVWRGHVSKGRTALRRGGGSP